MRTAKPARAAPGQGFVPSAAHSAGVVLGPLPAVAVPVVILTSSRPCGHVVLIVRAGSSAGHADPQQQGVCRGAADPSGVRGALGRICSAVTQAQKRGAFGRRRSPG